MDRETKEISIGQKNLSVSHVFKVKTYATAREARTIQEVYFKGAKIEINGEQPKISDFNPSIQFDLQAAMIEQMVVTMDGTAENIAGRCDDLPSAEYDELIAALDELVSKKKK